MKTLKLLMAIAMTVSTLLGNVLGGVLPLRPAQPIIRHHPPPQILGQRNPNPTKPPENEIDRILFEKVRTCDAEAVRYAISKGANVKSVAEPKPVRSSSSAALGAILGNGTTTPFVPLLAAIGNRPYGTRLSGSSIQKRYSITLTSWITYNLFNLDPVRYKPCTATIKALLEAGADPNTPANPRPLVEAAANPDNAEIVELLIKFGADPNASDIGEETALMSLVMAEFSDLTYASAAIDYLLDPQREVDYQRVKNQQIQPSGVYVAVGNMAIDSSVVKGISKGAYLENNTPEKRLERARHFAWRIESVMRQLKLLTSRGNIDTRSYTGKTALRLAVESINLFMVRELLKLGANPDVKDKQGKTIEDFIMLHSQMQDADRKAILALLQQAAQLRGKPLYSYSPPARLTGAVSVKSSPENPSAAKSPVAASTRTTTSANNTAPKAKVSATTGANSSRPSVGTTPPSKATGEQTGRVPQAGTTATPQPTAPQAQPTDRQLMVTAATPSEKRYALIIGNGGYTSAPLLNPPNDAKALAATLQQLGFEVTHQANMNQRTMKTAVRDFGEKLSQGGVGLFYYAGHGIQVKGRNYLVPVDAAIQRESDVEIECVDMDAILSQMERSNGTNIVILDACRNNPFARSWRSAAQGLAQVNAPAGTFIAYATAPGSVASDGSGSNGLYTEELLKAVREPNMSIEEVFKKVRVQVKARSKGLQVPWDASSLEGAFYFVPGKNGVSPTTMAGGSAANNFAASNPSSNTGGNAITPPPPVTTVPVRGLDVIERNFSSGLYDDVIRDAQALIASKPNDPKLNRLLGASLFEKGQFQQGATYLQQAILLGDSVTLKVQRHRQFLLNEKLESGTITLSKTGLELQFGNEVFKVPMNGIQKLVTERGGLASVSRLSLKAKGTEGDGGKDKEKTFNFYGLAARIQDVPKGNATQAQVHCNESECQAWAAEVTRIINAIPR